jgi:hypothetical protein
MNLKEATVRSLNPLIAGIIPVNNKNPQIFNILLFASDAINLLSSPLVAVPMALAKSIVELVT